MARGSAKRSDMRVNTAMQSADVAQLVGLLLMGIGVGLSVRVFTKAMMAKYERQFSHLFARIHQRINGIPHQ
jgi:hypothetical protein